ncbi:MAG: UDP-N-acetylmuramoyl-tripeptide--D-alanyl-D-alanine ligase [Candidatus Thiodiazotropha sp. (ex Dulcina madagascariensis)]|nr:UDP-N-acetylmuramoyl-tripeptide--D-alanyl-D-alanine ligase [Candidatus Thiodiazotropha sp. (ex Dulcina madagascariensis)]MCU7925627.1 UDP-N-acetylmuramoyl-tripeptide--D-alanyl-D-alanine ligase [Candidatus Thiodiazotropha sp. (ex Dulcina madagascariensis)]
MNSLRLSEVVEGLNARIVGEDVDFSAVSSDTRTLQQGDLFVALRGLNFDGHRFVDQAIDKGAAAVMVSESLDRTIPQILVANTRLGLGRLAGLWRERFKVPLAAITGSNGKTTVKELLAACLRERGPVLATQGNLNNDIGLPLTLLGLQEESYAVVEMGANHPGEIGYLSQIAHPDVAVITNAGAAHLEGFGDLRGVAQAKGEILYGLKPSGVAVLNADDDYFPLWRELLDERRMLSFGASARAAVRSDLSRATMRWTEGGFRSQMMVEFRDERFEARLALTGRHNLMNALAAIAAALAMGCSISEIQQGLDAMRSVAGRLQLLFAPSGFYLIDDSYNANPDSVNAAIEVLRKAPGEQYLVLGDLAELGDESVTLHSRIGAQARQAGLRHLYTLGGLSGHAADSFGEGGRAFSELDELADALHQAIRPGDTLLIKGSRSAAMERVVHCLMDEGRG